MRFLQRVPVRSARRLTPAIFATAFLGLVSSVLSPGAAYAQAIVLSVNGDPITSVDIEQQMKLLRALRKPATREAAVEAMIEDRLKGHEASRFGINIKDNEIGEEIQSTARKMRTSPQALMQSIAQAGVSNAHATEHFKSQFGYAILVKALNKGVEASEIAVRGELARDKGTTSTNYSIRQVVFTLNPDDPPAVVDASVKKAQALRTRFTTCDTGIPYAKSLPGVAVRAKVTRNSEQLTDGTRGVLDTTPVGHLTEPSRSPNGIEMLAICERSAAKNDDDRRKSIADRLLAQHFAQQEVEKYKEMRSRAVISRNQ